VLGRGVGTGNIKHQASSIKQPTGGGGLLKVWFYSVTVFPTVGMLVCGSLQALVRGKGKREGEPHQPYCGSYVGYALGGAQ